MASSRMQTMMTAMTTPLPSGGAEEQEQDAEVLPRETVLEVR